MLVTERLKLRAWREADKAPLAAIHADPEVMQYLGGTRTPRETSELIDRLISMANEGAPIFWAAERIADGELLGWIGLHEVGTEYPFGPALEIGWRLGREFWNEGYATEGARAALAHAFDTLRAPKVYAFTAQANTRSEAVMRKLGMKKIEGGEFAHPDFPPADPSCIHVLYVAEAVASAETRRPRTP
jgi:RimJ/RimL family protein N-acetyltransferase